MGRKFLDQESDDQLDSNPETVTGHWEEDMFIPDDEDAEPFYDLEAMNYDD